MKEAYKPQGGHQKRRLAALCLAAVLALSLTPAMTALAAGEEVIEVSTGAELDAALKSAAAGATVRLAADIDAISSATYAGRALTIDGNGHTVDGKGIEKSTIRFNGTSDITLKNISIQNCVGNIRYGGGGFAIFRGDLSVEDSSFINNLAMQGDGGGVLVDGAGTKGSSFVNCTFYGNKAAANGGAVASASSTSIINCTMVGNTAAANGGGAFNNSRAEGSTNTVINSMLIGNTATLGKDAYKLADGGNNLTGTVENAGEPSGDTVYGITLEDSAGWLAGRPDGNGYTVPTLALLDSEDSPAVDRANLEYAPARDQRGVSRGDRPDIGAYELERKIALGASVSTPTIVETLGAYLNISVRGAPDGIALSAYIEADGKLLHETAISGGKGRMYIPAAPQAGAYRLIVKGDGAEGSCDISVVAYNTDIWTAAAFAGEDGNLNARFNAAISSRTNFANAVKIDAVYYSAAVLGDNVLQVPVAYDSLKENEKIVITGVKFQKLFPSYSFTFNVTKQ